MASATSMAHPPGQKTVILNTHTSGTSAVLEKKNLSTARRSTPDSEALMSSDDDHEQTQAMSLSMHSAKSIPLGRPARRPSWLTEVQSSQQRKYSFGGTSLTSTSPQPTTPSAENGQYDTSSTSRPAASGASFPWHTQVWQKDRAPRLAEVLPSQPTSLTEDLRSPTAREQAPGSGLPFEIPLEPVRKNHRSQSYSVGQALLADIAGSDNPPPYGTLAKRSTGLLHRPSRPSMLGEGRDSTLGSLREDEDDVDSPIDSEQSGRVQTSPSNMNQINDFPPLRQVASETARGSQDRFFPDSIQTSGNKQQRRLVPGIPISPNSDYAVEEFDESNDAFANAVARNVLTSTSPSATTIPSIENRRFEAVRRSQWQSSLGFDIAEEGSQSRRHSFADLPSRTRNGSVAQAPDYGQGNHFDGYGHAAVGYPSHANIQEPNQRELAADEISYFAGAESHRRHLREGAANEGYNPFAVPNVYSRPAKILYIVSFKCKRADIFYIPENTGLQVKTGDTVIVEGDRGQDLGTVEHVNVTMEQAKKLKEDHSRQHFRCLMMFSRLYPHMAALAGNEELFDETLASQINATGSSAHTGPTSGHSRDVGLPFESEPRPKMIKRVAKPDEVHLLREKEGNEAKAKRVCQNKVSEHGLRMEILDAEFQHDYRKLTFFYYAEEYINFNDLVTDLFKVYKTRIWMSAINPASYTVMNPNNARAHAAPPRPSQQQQMGHVNYLRQQQELLRSGMDRQQPHSGELEDRMSMMNLNGPMSSIDQEQQLRNTTSTERLASSGSRGVGSPYSEAFQGQLQPRFDVREPNAVDLGARYTSFGPPFGAMTGNPWGQPAPNYPSGMPFGFPSNQESLGNYGAMPVSPAVAQNSAFTPRGGMTTFPYPGTAGIPASNGEATMDPNQQPQFARFPIEPRRA